jgi:hypothetical protein
MVRASPANVGVFNMAIMGLRPRIRSRMPLYCCPQLRAVLVWREAVTFDADELVYVTNTSAIRSAAAARQWVTAFDDEGGSYEATPFGAVGVPLARKHVR